VPNIYIIAGCNGAGKTTASFTILPEILNCKEFINADEIARGLSPFQPETVSFQTGRIMLLRINELTNYKSDFAIETTLTTLSYKNTIHKAREKGYTITLLFFWLNNVGLAIERVKNRVSEGGHYVPDDIVIKRYQKGIVTLTKVFIDICDRWVVVDNSTNHDQLIAEGCSNQTIKLHDENKWEQINYTTDAK
jgi:predicted ABC-type ATPase